VFGRRQLSAVYSVGGISIAIHGPGSDKAPPESTAFLVHDPRPEVVCHGRYAPAELEPGARLLSDPGGVWRVDELTEGRIRVVLRAGEPPGRPYHVLRLEPDLVRGEVTLDPTVTGESPEPFLLRAPLHELWTQFLLMRGRGALVHACALLAGDEVHLFAGASGAGKSTLATILADRYGTVLSDDRVIVRPEAGAYRAYGTPWHGDKRHASPRSGRLASVHFLAHSARTQRLTLPRHEAVARLAACCFLASFEPTGIKELLATCVRIVQSVPCYDLPFTPDDSAPRAVGIGPVS
jgi:hypothetical protein